MRERAGLPEDLSIISLLPIRPEQGNDIFFYAEGVGVRSELVHLQELNTFGEIAALHAIIHQRGIRRVLIVSTDIHLRRIRYAVRTLLGAMPVKVCPPGGA